MNNRRIVSNRTYTWRELAAKIVAGEFNLANRQLRYMAISRQFSDARRCRAGRTAPWGG